MNIFPEMFDVLIGNHRENDDSQYLDVGFIVKFWALNQLPSFESIVYLLPSFIGDGTLAV